jgi:hypothetical protein
MNRQPSQLHISLPTLFARLVTSCAVHLALSARRVISFSGPSNVAALRAVSTTHGGNRDAT